LLNRALAWDLDPAAIAGIVAHEWLMASDRLANWRGLSYSPIC
jgi:hypothetical protein